MNTADGISVLGYRLFSGLLRGNAIKNVRYRHRSLRKKLQKKRTLGSRRRLRKLAGQEYRYKALGAGVPIHRVDPRNTSRKCPSCKHIAKTNRKTQAVFICTRCGLAGHADVIAAENKGEA
jgi:predicted RNA-binding Zn-ribbon protein involved in translation (DUF1610 family)